MVKDVYSEPVVRYLVYTCVFVCMAIGVVGLLTSLSNPWNLEYIIYFTFPACCVIILFIIVCGYMANRCYPDPPPAPDLRVTLTQEPKVLVYEEPFSTDNPIHSSPSRQRSESREKSDKSLAREKSDKSLAREKSEKSLAREKSEKSLAREKSPKSSRRNSLDSTAIAIDVKEDSTFSVENPSLTTASSR
jgi:hypothetical protein